MNQLIIASAVAMSIFFGVSYMLFKMGISNMHWTKFVIIILSLLVLLSFFGAFLVRFLPGTENDQFIDMLKIILTLVSDTIKLFSQTSPPLAR